MLSEYMRPMRDGMKLQKKGIYHEAELKFREVLSICENKHTGASYSLACVLLQLACSAKDHDVRQRYMTESVEQCRKAIDGVMSREPKQRWKMLLECIQFLLQYTGVMKLDGNVSAPPICNVLKHKLLREAIELLKSCAEVVPTNQRVWSYLTQVLTIEKRYSEAVSAYESYLELGENATDATIQYRYAKALQRAEKYPEALAAYTAAVELSEGSHTMAVFWTRVLLEKVRLLWPLLRKPGTVVEDPTNTSESANNPSPLAESPPIITSEADTSGVTGTPALVSNTPDAADTFHAIIIRAKDILARYEAVSSGDNATEANQSSRDSDSDTDDVDETSTAGTGDNSATATGNNGRLLIPHEYVRKLFDRYASTFEQHLTQELKYSTPQCMAHILKNWYHQTTNVQRTPSSTASSANASVASAGNAMHKNPSWYRAGDIGCGTGLGALAFRLLAHEFYGCDLSPRMVEETKKRIGLYTRVEAAEAVSWLRQWSDNSFDLLLAADVLNYMGDLSPLFEQVKRVLKKESVPDGKTVGTPLHPTVPGVFIFSIEKLVEVQEPKPLEDSTGSGASCVPCVAHSAATEPVHGASEATSVQTTAQTDAPTQPDALARAPSQLQPPLQAQTSSMYKLSSDGRCQHSSEYIRDVVKAHNLVVLEEKDVVLRQNAGVDVLGVVFIVGRDE